MGESVLGGPVNHQFVGLAGKGRVMSSGATESWIDN